MNRHPSVEEKLVCLEPNTNLPSDAFEIAHKVQSLAYQVTDIVNDHPQLALGLQHLVDAKDCFIRALLLFQKEKEAPTQVN